MRIAVSGATGFIGNRLCQELAAAGHTVTPLNRELFDGTSSRPLRRIIENVDVVINLAGETINQRWTKRAKERILESRVITTRMIVNEMNLVNRPQVLISTSAVGYYPAVGCYDERNKVENFTFLSYICRVWEAEASKLKPTSRLIITRFGVVLDPAGGALPQMLKTKGLGFLAQIGPLERPMSWISRTDLIRAMLFIIDNDELEGVLNLTTPRLTLQDDFLTAAKEHYKIKYTIPIPIFLLHLLYGEGVEVLTQGQCVAPQRLIDCGFQFQQPDFCSLFNVD